MAWITQGSKTTFAVTTVNSYQASHESILKLNDLRSDLQLRDVIERIMQQVQDCGWQMKYKFALSGNAEHGTAKPPSLHCTCQCC